MSVHAPSATVDRARRVLIPRVELWLLLSGACLYLSTRLVDYGPESPDAAGGNLFVGVVLLLFVRSGSTVARGVVVVMSSTCAIVYALVSTTLTGFLIAVLFAVQAGALLTPSVRDQVQSARRRRKQR